jgi:microcystin-dependent protein
MIGANDTSHKLSINKTSPEATLEVGGSAIIDEALTVTGDTTLNSSLTVENETTLENKLEVTGKTTMTNELEVTSNITSTNGNINTEEGKVQENGHDLLPRGSIIMWSNLESQSVPNGWALCDGKTYNYYYDEDGTRLYEEAEAGTIKTPDLQDRFIVGAGGDYPKGDTGGEKEVTLTESQMPAHDHNIDDPGHEHNISYGILHGPDRSGTWAEGWSPHSKNYNDDKSTENSPTGIERTKSAGSGHAHENRPPYYALAFIMKL